MDKVEYGQLDFQTRYAERDAVVRATLRHPEAGELLLDGHVPVDLAWAGERWRLDDAPVDLMLTAFQLDLTLLATLAPETLRRSSGRVSLSLRIAGPRGAPHADGTIAIDADRLELVAAVVPTRTCASHRGARTALHYRMSPCRRRDAHRGGRHALAPGGATAVALRIASTTLRRASPSLRGVVSGEL